MLNMIVEVEFEPVCWVVLCLWHAGVWQFKLGYGNAY